MTKKHFILLAAALKRERPGENWDGSKRVQWNLGVRAIANVCSDVNNRFDTHTFFEACGGLFNI